MPAKHAKVLNPSAALVRVTLVRPLQVKFVALVEKNIGNSATDIEGPEPRASCAHGLVSRIAGALSGDSWQPSTRLGEKVLAQLLLK